MTRKQANSWLAARGFPGLEVSKAEGIWYLVGGHGDPRIVNFGVDRCLHVVRLADLTEQDLSSKLDELTKEP